MPTFFYGKIFLPSLLYLTLFTPLQACICHLPPLDDSVHLCDIHWCLVYALLWLVHDICIVRLFNHHHKRSAI